jgi:hypothetical protein
LSPISLVFIINVSENRRGNPEWTIQGSRTLSTLGTQDKVAEAFRMLSIFNYNFTGIVCYHNKNISVVRLYARFNYRRLQLVDIIHLYIHVYIALVFVQLSIMNRNILA